MKTAVARGTRGNRTYRIWAAMKGRCQRRTSPDFPRWGGRGIKVCEKWQYFSGFLEDMGEAPTGMTLDRINTNGNYEPGNCRLATRKIQSRNKTNNRLISHEGKSLCAAEWGEITGLKQKTIVRRIKLGWSVERALTVPTGAESKTNKFHPEDVNRIMDMRKSGLSFRSIAKRLNVTNCAVGKFLKRMGVNYAGR